MSTKQKIAQEPVFTKDALVNSKKFRNERDLLSAILKDDVEYTISEVEEMIMKYMKGKVK
jgi:hypothetical protein